MTKKIVMLLIFGILLICVPMSAKAVVFIDGQSVEANKNWTIHFNEDVELNDLSKQEIKVMDSKGNAANIILSFGQDDKTLIVNAPRSGYISGEKYTLNIGGKVNNKKGQNLKKSISMSFSIKDDNSVVTFKDKNLEQVVRNVINKPTGDLLKSDVKKITGLNLGLIAPVNSDREVEVKDLSGIENLTNLQELYLYHTQISDISPLKGLINLQTIWLCGTQAVIQM